LAATGWSDELKDAFLRSQFDAQDRHYRDVYPDAAYDVIYAGALPAGRLYVARRAGDLRVIDISLLPAFRGKGIGSAILGNLIDEAAAGNRSISVHVERDNRARRLYERLGFAAADTHGLYVLMVRAPRPVAVGTAQLNTAS
jgi:ribosomal protein S18 acetylase RimI-like enzyme